jgi:hypothetical protein
LGADRDSLHYVTCAALYMSEGFFRFRWLPYLCYGLAVLLSIPKQEGESSAAYLRKPRAIAIVTLTIVALAGFALNLHHLWTK